MCGVPTERFPTYLNGLSLHPYARQEMKSMETIDHLPVLKNEHGTSSQVSWNLDTIQHCLDIVFESIRDGLENGWWLMFKGETKPTLVYPIIAVLILDYEACQLCYCIMHGQNHRPMCSCMCSRHTLSSHSTSDGAGGLGANLGNELGPRC